MDRPEGKAGGQGLGFNGAQLLAFALGGCFCNDLRYAAEAMRLEIDAIAVTAEVVLDGDPLLVVGAELTVSCVLKGGVDSGPLIERAQSISTVANSLRHGMSVSIRADAKVPPQLTRHHMTMA